GAESGGGWDDIGYAWRGGVEQLHRAGDGQRGRVGNQAALARDQSGGFRHYDVVTARGHRGGGLLTSTRRNWGNAAVLVVRIKRNAARGAESDSGRYDIGHAGRGRIEQLHRARDG